jgi:hypothetical protein
MCGRSSPAPTPDVLRRCFGHHFRTAMQLAQNFPITGSLGSFAARYRQALPTRNGETPCARTRRTAQHRTVPATSRDAARRSGYTTGHPEATSPRHVQSIPARNPRRPRTAVRNPPRLTAPIRRPVVEDNWGRAHRHRPRGATLRLLSRLHAASVFTDTARNLLFMRNPPCTRDR